jgi:hypothetical protein
MTAPNAFLVDQNSTITPKIGISVDATSGAPTILTADNTGAQVATLVGAGGGGTPASTVSPKAVGSGAVGSATTYARQDHAHPVNTPADVGALPVPTNWAASAGGGTPTLTSGTAVLGVAYRNTTAGTTTLSPAIDSITSVSQDDCLFCFTPGTWTLSPVAGAGSVTFAATVPAGNATDNTSLAAALATKETTLAPVTLTAATNLVRNTHGNRSIWWNGGNATLTVQLDASGGTTLDDYFEVHTLATATGVPTLVTPDGKTITGSATRIVSVVRKGTPDGSWTAGTTDPATSGGGMTLDIGCGCNFRIEPGQVGGVSVSSYGTPGGSLVGTLTASTGVVTGVGFKKRVGVVSAAAVNSNSYYSTVTSGAHFIMPDTATTWIPQPSRYVFNVADALTACRVGGGLLSGVPGVTVEPSALLNCAFFGADSTDTQLTFMTNDGSGACTKTVLNGGAGFPANTNTADVYECWINLRGGATPAIDYYIINRVTLVKATGTITANIPVAATGLLAAVYRNTAANATAAKIDFTLIAGGMDAMQGATS